MTVIGNILWFLFGGLIGGLAWVLAGCLWCVTIIGIPVGLQCFKFASLAFFPFGKEVIYGGGGFSAACLSALAATASGKQTIVIPSLVLSNFDQSAYTGSNTQKRRNTRS